ncbi:hypothetical protein DSECCO2_384760 [anaerobic digester metagenome]
MKVKALISFSGAVSMTQGQTIQVEEGEVLTGLLSCGYVEEVEEKKPYIGIDLSNVASELEPQGEPKQKLETEPEPEPVEEQATEPATEQVVEPVAEPVAEKKSSKSKAVNANESK